MTGTPAAWAFLITAVPLPASRSVMTRTLTPSVSIWSAMVWNWAGSPWAFWMSLFTPAASKACFRKGLSAVSQRTEDLVSGRMTPMSGVLAAGLEPEPALLLLELPHADRPPATTSPAAAKARIPLRICTGPFGVCAAPGGGRVVHSCLVRLVAGPAGARTGPGRPSREPIVVPGNVFRRHTPAQDDSRVKFVVGSNNSATWGARAECGRRGYP